jgi:hypothetical protein
VIRSVVTGVSDEAWAAAVASDPLALPDHDRGWFSAMAVRGRWRDASRLYALDDGSSILLPLVERGGRGPGASVAASPPAGSGFGGLVGERARDPEVVAAVLAEVSGHGWLSLRIRPIPEAGWSLADSAGSARAVARRAHLLDLSGDASDVFDRMRKSTRRTVRRHLDGSRGFKVEQAQGGTDLAVYEQLRARSVERWAHASREPVALARWRAGRGGPDVALRRLADAMGDRFTSWVAWSGDRPAAVNLMVTGPTSHVMRSAIDHELVGSSGLMQHLDWLAIEHGHACGSHTLNLGESGSSTSLASYKESVGAVAHDYAEVRFERLPVTRVDAAARTLVKRAVGFRDPT